VRGALSAWLICCHVDMNDTDCGSLTGHFGEEGVATIPCMIVALYALDAIHTLLKHLQY
jgi:hypothetical protein